MADGPQVRELVLTGGPCAGKTTALARLSAVVAKAGWRVLAAPEAATTFICGGVADVGVPVRKRRRCFVWAGRRWELDEFLAPRTGWLLEVELTSADERVELPPFLTVEREVTADPAWRNAAIADVR